RRGGRSGARDGREFPARTREEVPAARGVEEPALRVRGRRVRRVAAAIAIVALCMGCGGAPPTPAPPPLPPLHLAPLPDLAPAAGLSWIVIARPRDLAARADLIPALHALVPEERLATFAARNGGVSPLELEELVAATYRATTLYLARGMIDPSRVEGAFAARE